MISKDEFDEYVKTLITDEDSQNYAKSRKKSNTILWILISIEIVLGVIIAFAVSVVPGIFTMIFAVLLTIAIVSAVFKNKWKSYKTEKAKQILAHILKDYQYSYDANGFIPPVIFHQSGFAYFYDDYEGEDYLTITIPNEDGSPSNVTCHICDLHLTRTETSTDSHGHTHTTTTTVFSGVFAYMNFPQSFKCTLGVNHRARNTEKIRLEDIEYNKTFSVYTDNELEAYRILTPVMMEKLLGFNKKTKKTKVSMMGNSMFLAFESMNLFELKRGGKKLNVEAFENFYNDLQRILALVNEVKNNKKVFKLNKE